MDHSDLTEIERFKKRIYHYRDEMNIYIYIFNPEVPLFLNHQNIIAHI